MIPRLTTAALTASLAMVLPAWSFVASSVDMSTVSRVSHDSVVWSKRVCGAVSAPAAKLAEVPRLNASEPQHIKKDVLAYLTEMGSTLDALAERLRAVGPPPVTGGARMTDRALDSVNQARSALDRATTKAEKLRPDDSLKDTMAAIGTDMRALREVDAVLREFEDAPELSHALAATEACRESIA